jgi:hypothetical protein
MPKQLLIVFSKPPELGKVKTRLATTVGSKTALLIFEKLLQKVKHTIAHINVTKHIYLTNFLINDQTWKGYQHFLQEGSDIGQRMKNAINNSFNKGFDQIILIGTDIPDLNADIIQQSFDILANNDVVLGPSEDGGYYLIGMSKNKTSLFNNKPYSTNELLKTTINELNQKKISYKLLPVLNDIDTFEDLKKSNFYNEITENLLPKS